MFILTKPGRWNWKQGQLSEYFEDQIPAWLPPSGLAALTNWIPVRFKWLFSSVSSYRQNCELSKTRDSRGLPSFSHLHEGSCLNNPREVIQFCTWPSSKDISQLSRHSTIFGPHTASYHLQKLKLNQDSLWYRSGSCSGKKAWAIPTVLWKLMGFQSRS